MSWKIGMTLDLNSIQKAAEDLKEYAIKVQFAADETERRLCHIAAEEAASHFDDTVMVAAIEHGVMAAGESVVFQEFGAGARISDPFEGGADVDFEIRRGAYSDIERPVGPNGEMGVGEYAQTGYEYWHHGDELFTYVTPVSGLFHGEEAARGQAAKIAKEEFGKA